MRVFLAKLLFPPRYLANLIVSPTKNVMIPANKKSSANKSTNRKIIMSKMVRLNSWPYNKTAENELLVPSKFIY